MDILYTIESTVEGQDSYYQRRDRPLVGVLGIKRWNSVRERAGGSQEGESSRQAYHDCRNRCLG